MRYSLVQDLIGAAASACLLAAAAALPWAAAAQTGGPPGSPALPEHSAPQTESEGDGAVPPELREVLPDRAVERAKMLDNLYALLATAEDEQAAEQTSKAILKLWATSGSDTVTVLMARAVKAMQDKNQSLALRLLDAIVEQAPDYAEGWSQRAHVLYLEGQARRAIGDLRRALALDPNHFRALSALGHILREYGEKNGALTAYRKLLDVHPFAEGAGQAVDELEREVGGQGI
ncbi:MAG: tetratricopeptide repeat protein [Hyphomicrobiaceae bacterium]|nr:tetratricopeptide repeat protein [Hyphomicrobiaceae bacterium]